MSAETDRAEIVAVLDRYAEALDRRRWELLRDVFADDVRIDFGEWTATSRDQAVRRRDVARALVRIDRGPLIVAGDMNLTPWAAAMREQDRAFAPLVRMTRALPSWPRAFPLLPIDQLYAGPDWALVSARALPATGSDHRPLLVALARR